MTTQDIDRVVDEYGRRFDPLITLEQAAQIAHCPLGTLHDWSGRGLLDGFKSKRGRRVLLVRDGFVRFLLSEKRP